MTKIGYSVCLDNVKEPPILILCSLDSNHSNQAGLFHFLTNNCTKSGRFFLRSDSFNSLVLNFLRRNNDTGMYKSEYSPQDME